MNRSRTPWARARRWWYRTPTERVVMAVGAICGVVLLVGVLGWYLVR